MESSRFVLAVALLFTVALATIQLTNAQHSPKDYLDAHNEAREDVGVEPVEWDSKLEDYARKHAMKQIGDCWPVKYSYGPYGENIF